MVSVRKVGLFALVILAASAPFAFCEEEAAVGAVVGDAGVGMAGYQPASNVDQHSYMDRDIRDIQKKGSNYAEALAIYTTGKNGMSGDKLRSLQSMSTKYVTDESVRDEMMAKLGHAFWGEWDYANQHLLAAFTPSDHEDQDGEYRYGDYNTGVVAKTDAARKQMIKKVLKFTLLLQYALHELEASYKKYTDTSKTDEERYGLGGAVHAFDEFWAFYVGSLEDGSAEGDEEDGDGLGYGPYIMAEKKSDAFGTAGYVVSNGGKSKVNWELMFQAHAAKRYLQQPGNEKEVKEILFCIRSQIKVPLIQACLDYTWTVTQVVADDFAKYKGEMWAMCSAALPFLHEVDDLAASKLYSETTIDNTRNPNWDVVKGAFSAQNLNMMGLRCADIGHLGEPKEANHKECRDVNLSADKKNKYADAWICPKVKMPNAGSMLQGASWLLSLAAVSLAYLMK